MSDYGDCAKCGHEIEEIAYRLVIERPDVVLTYFFCSAECRTAYRKEMANPVWHGLYESGKGGR
jgi:hypothetical protein